MKTVFALLPIAALFAVQAPTLAAPSVTNVCTFDRSKGDTSIGMRNGFVLRQNGNNTVAVYESLPSSVSSRIQGVTISSSRTLTFFNSSIAAARTKLLANPALYDELLGSKYEKGFKAVNDNLICTGGSSSNVKSIAELPDGTYTYWSGKPNPPDRKMTDEALLKAGGILYIFTKKGPSVTGNFAPIDNQGICVEGQLDGNTVTGMAYPPDGVGTASPGLFSWHPSGYLKVGSWEPKKATKPGHYHQAKLDLSAFNPIVRNGDRPLTPKASCMSK